MLARIEQFRRQITGGSLQRNFTMRIILPIFALALSFSSAALAETESTKSCGDAPQSTWLSKEQLKVKATALGLNVRGIKIENGCYEVAAIDKDGKKVDKVMNPVSGEVVDAEAVK
jgi:hypothetical protein